MITSFLNRKLKARKDAEISRRLGRVIRKAAEFHRLEAGWYFGRGAAISSDAIECAISLVKLANAEGLWKCNAFPRVDGGVRVDFVQSKHEVEISIEADGLCSILHEVDGETVAYEDELTFSRAAFFLRAIARKVCTSEQSTQSISMMKITGLARRRASRPATAVFLSSAKTVRLVSQAPSMLIFEHTTQASPPTQQFFGGSTASISPQMLIGGSSKAPKIQTLAT